MKSVDFSSFDEKARSVVVRAQGEARRLQHDWIGPEHLLLGYLQEYEAGAESAGARRTLRDIRIATESLFPPGEVVSAERLLLSPQAVYALEQAPEKAMSMSQSAVKPEHILIALTSFPDSSVSSARRLQYRSAGAVRPNARVPPLWGRDEPAQLGRSDFVANSRIASALLPELNRALDIAEEAQRRVGVQRLQQLKLDVPASRYVIRACATGLSSWWITANPR